MNTSEEPRVAFQRTGVQAATEKHPSNAADAAFNQQTTLKDRTNTSNDFRESEQVHRGKNGLLRIKYTKHERIILKVTQLL